MLIFIGNTILWTLAIYGLFEIIKTIIYIFSYTNLKSDGIYIISISKTICFTLFSFSETE